MRIFLFVFILLFTSCKQDYTYLLKTCEFNGRIVKSWEYDNKGNLIAFTWGNKTYNLNDIKAKEEEYIKDGTNKVLFRRRYHIAGLYETNYYYDDNNYLTTKIEKRYVGQNNENIFTITTYTYEYDDGLPFKIVESTKVDNRFGLGTDYTIEYKLVYKDEYFFNECFMDEIYNGLPDNPLRYKNDYSENLSNFKLIDAIIKNYSDQPTEVIKFEYLKDENGNVNEMTKNFSGHINVKNVYKYSYSRLK